MTRDNTATRSSRFIVSTMHLQGRQRAGYRRWLKLDLAREEKCWTHFSNHSVRLVVWRIMRSRLGEFFSLSSLVQTLPTSSDGLTALQKEAALRSNLTNYGSAPPFSGSPHL